MQDPGKQLGRPGRPIPYTGRIVCAIQPPARSWEPKIAMLPEISWKLSHHAGCVREKRIVNGFQDGDIAHVNGHTFRVGVIAGCRV